MAMANMNLIGVFVTKLWPVQALACGGGDGGGLGGGTKNIVPPKFSNFIDIIMADISHRREENIFLAFEICLRLTEERVSIS